MPERRLAEAVLGPKPHLPRNVGLDTWPVHCGIL
jgi:hypothetical protein